MRFFAVAAALIGAVAAGAYDTCAVVTVTETVTAGHVPSAPGSLGPTAPAPYPTSGAPYPVSSGGYSAPPYPMSTGGYSAAPYPTGTGAPYPSGTGAPQPSGTGAYTSSYPQFTGAASHAQIGGFVAGVGAFAALFL